MSRVKKSIITIIMAIVAILGISTISKAYYVNQNLALTYNDYLNNKNIFCLEHGQALVSRKMYYRVASQVKIEGTKSTDHTGKTINNWSNAKFAYILSKDNGSSKRTGPVANAIWNYGYTWMANVGQYHAGLYNGFASSTKGSPTWLDQESTNYANNLTAGDQQIKDNTNKNNVKVVAYNKDGKAYMRVGPFNWTFGGKVTDVNVYDQNGQSISEKLYSSYYGNEERFYGVGNIKSGSDFYISVPLNENTTKITKISGNLQREVKAVNIWFLESNYAAYQNLIVREPYTTTENIPFTFDENISTLGGLKVIKVNKDNTKKRKIRIPVHFSPPFPSEPAQKKRAPLVERPPLPVGRRPSFEYELRLHAVFQLDRLELERILLRDTLRIGHSLCAAHQHRIIVHDRQHVAVRVVDVEALADRLSDGAGHLLRALPGVAHGLQTHLLLVFIQLRVGHLQDRNVRDPQVVERLPDLCHLARRPQLELVLGHSHRSVLLEELAREVGHLELLLDIDPELPEHGNHVALLALDRDLALRIAFVDDDL